MSQDEKTMALGQARPLDEVGAMLVKGMPAAIAA